MEKRLEEIVANETIAGSAEFKRECNISMDPIEPDDCRSVAPSCLCESTSCNWPGNGNSTLTNLDTVKDYSSNKGEMSLVDSTSTLTSSYPSTCVAGCSNTKVGNNEPRRWLRQFENKGKKSRITDEDFRRTFSTFQNIKNLSRNLNNVDHITEAPSNFISSDRPLTGSPSGSLFSCNRTSTQAMAGPSNIISSNKPLKDSLSSSFSEFFLGQYLKTTTKGVPYLKAFDESWTKLVVQNKTHNMLTTTNDEMCGYSSREASNTLVNRSSLSFQLQSHDIVKNEPEIRHHGINLREWLESMGANTSKAERLRIFRKIVQIVDFAHSRGIALMELRPSSFIVFENRDVHYIGSLMETEPWSMIQDNIKIRGLEPNVFAHENSREKMQKVSEDKLVRPETCINSRIVTGKATTQLSHGNFDLKNSCHSLWNKQNFSIYEGTSTGNSWLTYDNAQLEKKWYAFPEGLKIGYLLSSNIYSLGLLLFEFLCHFESIEAHSIAMLNLNHRILPPHFLSQSPMEAGFCFCLLHPEPLSRPTTREILQSELIYDNKSTKMSTEETSYAEMVDDAETDLLLNFLVTLKQQKQKKASNLLESLELLDTDIKMVESRQACGKYVAMMGDHRSVESPSSFRMNEIREKLLGKINELENVYFSLRSNIVVSEMPVIERSDKDILRERDRLPWTQTRHSWPTAEEESVDHVGVFFDGICSFARCNKFEVCGALRNDDVLNSDNVISSLSFDCEEDFIAAAGASKKIKIYEFASLLDDFSDVHYPVLEMSNKSKFSCICWNNYIRNYLASADYDGSVQIWNANTGQGFAQYNHQKRVWSVDFSRIDPMRFASGGDDCFLRLWTINERNLACTIQNRASICCVQFSSHSSHLLAFGSADYRIYCYDLRHTRIPWCTVAGHDNAVSYVRFLDSDTFVSASTDSTLKLWDLKKTTLDGLSPNACSLTFSGHTNERNFVGLTVLDGYIACGSETNEVYAYYRSLPMPIISHKFGYVDPISGDEIDDGNGHFVSSVCWRRKSQMLAAANSSGSIKILSMV